MLKEQAIWTARTEILDIACRRLASFGVPFYVWKGADFAYSLYGSPLERPMSDLDLLVDERFAGMASSLLHSTGFRRYTPGPGLFSSGVIGETKFFMGGFLLELHTHPLYHPGILPGSIPPVSSFSAKRFPGGRPAPGWIETALYTYLNLAGSGSVNPWQRRDLELIEEKLDQAGREELAWLLKRAGWKDRVMDMLLGRSPGKPGRWSEGTAGALFAMRGWRRTAFAAGVFFRFITGRAPGREG